MPLKNKTHYKGLLRIASLLMTLLLFTPATSLAAQEISKSEPSRLSVIEATSPKCTKKLVWYTKGSEICAPTKSVGSYKWQASMKRADTTKFMKTCRSFFATTYGQLLCDWMQKYVNNILTLKGPRDNCLTYWKDLLDNAALIGQTNKSATLGSLLSPYTAEHSWICHP